MSVSGKLCVFLDSKRSILFAEYSRGALTSGGFLNEDGSLTIEATIRILRAWTEPARSIDDTQESLSASYHSRHRTGSIGFHSHSDGNNLVAALATAYFHVPAIRSALSASARRRSRSGEDGSVGSGLWRLFDSLQNSTESACTLDLEAALEAAHVDLNGQAALLVKKFCDLSRCSAMESFVKGRLADKKSFVCTPLCCSAFRQGYSHLTTSRSADTDHGPRRVRPTECRI